MEKRIILVCELVSLSWNIEESDGEDIEERFLCCG